MTIYLHLFWEFFKTGLFAVGGGMATIPFLYEMSAATGWFTEKDLANMIAVSESTPGPIGINMATYVGYITGSTQHGFVGSLMGAIVATLGIVTPSIIVILLIAVFLKGFRDNLYVGRAFAGLRPASTALIASAGLSVMVSNLFHPENGLSFASVNWKGLALGLFLWVMTNYVKKTRSLHPILFIAFSAVVGIVLKMG